MRILCFDTESSHYFHSQRWQYGNDESFIAARLAEAGTMSSKAFYGAVIYDFARREYREFSKKDIHRLVGVLARADLLISHSGTYKDFVILEDFCGREALALILEKPHYDLYRDRSYEAVEDAARRLFPKQEDEARKKKLARQSIGGSHFYLAKARYDVEMTWRIAVREQSFRTLRESVDRQLKID
ncbi:MAG TPA: hypothetical protein VND94_18940 [Terriglobia bacterium]|nr:hypothetical protein [Terriglobia bacterium]